ncbi:MAG: zinc finger protein [Pseudonocardiaceae bacterium]
MHLDPPESFPQPPSFFWLPIDDQRHAAGIQDRNQPPGILITMLCRRQLTQTQVTDAEWQWPVCGECWSAAEAHIGLQAFSSEGNQT